MACSAIPAGFRALPLPLTQLSLAAVLKCGQSFRWSVIPLSEPKSSKDEDVFLDTTTATLDVEYRFALRDRVVCLRQSKEMLYYRTVFPEANANASRSTFGPSRPALVSTQLGSNLDLHEEETLAWLRDYFQLDVDLESLYDTWEASDPVFSKFRSRFEGIRMLRQDPWECLISFICSQNNHISRITKMVQSLCTRFSPAVLALPHPSSSSLSQSPQAYHPFPTPSVLASPQTSSILRTLGFGYRAEYIQRTAQMLVEQHGIQGAEQFLIGLRKKETEQAREELMKFVGVGRKVADCVLLMSLDKHNIVPVDTHVHKIALKHYGLRSSGKATMTPKLYEEIQMNFAKVWGSYAGWTHTVLFTADLKSFSTYGLPTPSPSVSPEKPKGKSKAKRSTQSDDESSPPSPLAMKRKRVKEQVIKEEKWQEQKSIAKNIEAREDLGVIGGGSLADRVKRRRTLSKQSKLETIYVESVPA